MRILAKIPYYLLLVANSLIIGYLVLNQSKHGVDFRFNPIILSAAALAGIASIHVYYQGNVRLLRKYIILIPLTIAFPFYLRLVGSIYGYEEWIKVYKMPDPDPIWLHMAKIVLIPVSAYFLLDILLERIIKTKTVAIQSGNQDARPGRNRKEQ